jgi:hypothetical protein
MTPRNQYAAATAYWSQSHTFAVCQSGSVC